MGTRRSVSDRRRGLVGLVLATLAVVLVPLPVLGGVVECGGEPATIVGTDGPDELIGTSGPDVIAGLGGNDVIRGLGGDDRLCGNAGHDLIVGGRGSDWISGGQGRDHLRGARGGDTVFGGAGRDAIVGGRGADALFGGSHRDVVRGGDRNDVIHGGDGNDTLLGGIASDYVVGGAGVDFCRGERRDTCESFDSRLRVKPNGVGDLVFGDNTVFVLDELVAGWGEPESDTGWVENGGVLGVCPGADEVRGVSFSSSEGWLNARFIRQLGTVGELFSLTADGLVTGRGIRGGETLAQLSVAYRDVHVEPEPDVIEVSSGGGGLFFVWYGSQMFRTTSLGDSHFDSTADVGAGGQCHA